ncbi:FK506 binding protein proline rotamase rapamycin-binding protein [Podila minutissima]|nr:FK506 binding protein proline rotamase rapamycin-binding protein [Podila minutissima]
MGVTKTTVTPGDGINFPQRGQTVLESGRKFDSSRDRGDPFITQIGVGRVIKGWDQGVPLMSVGERAILRMTHDFAYGARGVPPVIPGFSNLVFDVELLEIRD